MRRLIALTAVLLALGIAACGSDDETSSTATPTTSGATGAQGPSSGEMTAREFIDASIPDQIEAVTEAVEANPECGDADTAPGSDFQVSVAIDAASAAPETPISEIVADNC